MRSSNKIKHVLITIIMTIILGVPIGRNYFNTDDQLIDQDGYSITPQMPNKPPFVAGNKSYVEVNGNIPYFTDKDISSVNPWVEFSKLDEFKRVGAANAVLTTDLMPADQFSRQNQSSIKPSGWQQGKYPNVSGGWLYNRSHLIGYQLAGDGISELNLMTGTRWFNIDGMLPFENFVAATIENEDLAVRYRVTPFFEGGNLLASGAFMEGFSIEDNGDSLQFNIYIPNRQEHIAIDYGTGNHDSKSIEQTNMTPPTKTSHPGTVLFNN